MRIQSLNEFGVFGLHKSKMANQTSNAKIKLSSPVRDIVSFSSKAQCLKKYNTLPDEIKELLSPEDAIDMFEDMERVAKGTQKRQIIGQGENSIVYINPWLSGYYVLVLKEPATDKNQIIYSPKDLGDSVWCDGKDDRIQIIKAK